MYFRKNAIYKFNKYSIKYKEKQIPRNYFKNSISNSYIVWDNMATNCYKCNSKLIGIESTYITKKKKICRITHKKCMNCNINYIFSSYNYDGFYKNNNVILFTSTVIDSSNDKINKSFILDKTDIIESKNITNHTKKKNFFEEVSVYDSINVSCFRKHKEFIIQTPLKFKSLEIDCIKTANGFYCKKCNKKFITSEAIYNYTDKLFVPQFKCVVVNSSNVKNLNDESVLALYGYTVKANYLSDDERHSILEYVLNNGIMTATDVINLLEFNIKFKSNNLSMRNACEKWYEDIQYIYKIK